MFLQKGVLVVTIFLLGVCKGFAQKDLLYSISSDMAVNQAASLSKIYSASRVDSRPRIDGILDDLCWKTAVWDDSFIQQQPQEAHDPSQKTSIALAYDDDNLYVGIKCYDSNIEGVRSILSRRDEYNGDMVGIALDSYADDRTAFEFNVTAAGQKIDMMHLGQDEVDFNWDAIWDAATSINDTMWIAELRIPFSQLRFAKAEEQVWGLHAWRYIDRLGEEDHWKLIPVDAPATVYLFGDVDNIRNINTKRKLELLPYGNLKYSPNTELKNEWKAGAGIDGKVGLSSDFTLDFTVNPDFGQVEADPSILSLKSYEIFYDEKRPFFLEGNNVLGFNSGSDQLFYSRRIGHAPSFEPDTEPGQQLSMPENTSIISAAKVTGKTKRGLSVGFLHSMTAKESATVYGDDADQKITVEPFSNYFVGRVKQDFNKGNTVLGGMLTSVARNISDEHLSFLPKSSLTGGIDFLHSWNKRKYYVKMKGFYSDVRGSEDAISDLQRASQHYYQRPDASHLEYDPTRTSLSGHGGEFEGGLHNGKIRATGNFSWRSPGVDLNDVGYIYQADYLKESGTLYYMMSKPWWITRSYWFRINQEANWSYGGEKTSQEIGSHAYLYFRNLWKVHLNMKRVYNVYDTRELRGGPSLFKEPSWEAEVFCQTNASKDFFVGFQKRWVVGDDNISHRNLNVLNLIFRLGNNFSLSTNAIYVENSDYHQFAKPVVPHSEDIYVVGKIDQKILQATFRLEYFLTPELSLQYYASPYASIGKYSEFRRVLDGSNKDINQRYLNLQGSLDGGFYDFTEGSETYSMRNPDFTFKEFNSNLVARWEFRPGSTLYFVWNNTISDYMPEYNSSVTKVFRDIPGTSSQNLFMLKFTYWFTL